MLEAGSESFKVASTIMAVDDDPVALLMISELLKKLGYQTLTATSGSAALEMMEQGSVPQVLLLDRQMPGLSGMDVVHHLKEKKQFARIPVIMVTGSDDPKEIREGIDAGVFYYLHKPAHVGVLSSVLAAALRQASESTALVHETVPQVGFDLCEAAKWTFRTPREATALAATIANYFPDPDRSVDGIGALLLNAVEHGICAIGFEEKGRLLEEGQLSQSIKERLIQNPDTRATAAISRRDDGMMLIVDDPGAGFNWSEFTTLDLSRSSASHGRGIARAKAMAFDDLKFNEAGNRAIAFMRYNATFEW
ncbi:response regulator receiver domain-containing protein [Rhodobacter aestuarii]|uniref:Response regulator receiver domain-containing protein n=1 Tax=Rhodobacter aestuarii TaxID=453582 RepID=A0A1N7IY10_9RHOB|nr:MULTISPECIES: response regulator [Rhodobacter]PTV97407.1 response regulator receiver domain-containing protein [Rhodobacter aestuarii]SIS41970.1 Response regulator receiver domain-containing protein [Rhodobacter aestuarii]SOC00342.1 response regulator receiver domain-containing protein [Rhodobacter sp. JA431]